MLQLGSTERGVTAKYLPTDVCHVSPYRGSGLVCIVYSVGVAVLKTARLAASGVSCLGYLPMDISALALGQPPPSDL